MLKIKFEAFDGQETDELNYIVGVCHTNTYSKQNKLSGNIFAVSPLGFRKKQGLLTKKNRALKYPKTGEIRANEHAKNRKTGTFSWHTLVYIFETK